MNPDLKARWLTALQDGSFKKARWRLRRTHRKTGVVIGHCCLGVLGELGGVDQALLKSGGQLDDSALRFVGLTYDQQRDLMPLNDNNGGWADVIAYIEEKV